MFSNCTNVNLPSKDVALLETLFGKEKLILQERKYSIILVQKLYY